jgi:hypothetical protein
VVSGHQKVAAALARQGQGKGLAGTLTPALARQLLAGDVAVYVDLTAVAREYAKHIKAIREDYVDPFLDRLPDAKVVSRSMADMLRTAAAGLFQVVTDGRSVLLTLDFRPEGAALHLEVNVGAGTKSDKFLRSFKPAALAELKRLPTGWASYSASELGPGTYQWLQANVMKPLPFSAGWDDDEEENKGAAQAIKEAVKELVAARPLRSLGARKVDGLEDLIIWEFADPAKGAAAHLRLFQALERGSEYANMPLKEKPVIKPESQKYRDTRLHYVTIKYDFEKLRDSAIGSQDLVETVRKAFGEGQKFWFGVVNKQYVQVSARDWATAAKRLDAYLDNKGHIGDKNKAFTQTRDHLPAKVTELSLLDMEPMAQMMGQMFYRFGKTMGAPVKPPPPPTQKTSSNFVGMALTFQAGQASIDIWVPIGVVHDFRRVLEPMLKKTDD